MKIEILKKTSHLCQYTITRSNASVEHISLDTKTYFLHDICHFVVEKNLHYTKGFWGMLAAGYSFEALFGKDNPQTVELRFIEQIVGPVQSVYWGHITLSSFNDFIQHLDFSMEASTLNKCLDEIGAIVKKWEHLPTGQTMVLQW